MPSLYRLIVRIEPMDEKGQVLTGHPATQIKQIRYRDDAVFEAEAMAHAQRMVRDAAQDVLAMNRDGT